VFSLRIATCPLPSCLAPLRVAVGAASCCPPGRAAQRYEFYAAGTFTRFADSRSGSSTAARLHLALRADTSRRSFGTKRLIMKNILQRAVYKSFTVRSTDLVQEVNRQGAHEGEGRRVYEEAKPMSHVAAQRLHTEQLGGAAASPTPRAHHEQHGEDTAQVIMAAQPLHFITLSIRRHDGMRKQPSAARFLITVASPATAAHCD
jgi:hypothetical protein